MFKTANNDGISRPNSRPKLPFPGNGKGKFKMPREGKGREIWGFYSRESRETGIPAHPWSSLEEELQWWGGGNNHLMQNNFLPTKSAAQPAGWMKRREIFWGNFVKWKVAVVKMFKNVLFSPFWSFGNFWWMEYICIFGADDDLSLLRKYLVYLGGDPLWVPPIWRLQMHRGSRSST